MNPHTVEESSFRGSQNPDYGAVRVGGSEHIQISMKQTDEGSMDVSVRCTREISIMACASTCLIVASFCGFSWWKSAPLFTSEHLPTDPYSEQFCGLLIYLFLLPAGVASLLLTALNASKRLPHHRGTLFGLLATACLACAILALYVWGRFWDTDSSDLGDGSAVVVSTGMGLCVALVAMSGMFGWLSLRASESTCWLVTCSAMGDQAIVASFLFLAIPACFAAACFLPNTFQHFTGKKLAQPLSFSASDGAAVKIGAVSFHVFWDVLIFYSFIYLLCIVAIAGRRCWANHNPHPDPDWTLTLTVTLTNRRWKELPSSASVAAQTPGSHQDWLAPSWEGLERGRGTCCQNCTCGAPCGHTHRHHNQSCDPGLNACCTTRKMHLGSVCMAWTMQVSWPGHLPCFVSVKSAYAQPATMLSERTIHE